MAAIQNGDANHNGGDAKPAVLFGELLAAPVSALIPESPEVDASRAMSVAIALMASEVSLANDRFQGELTRSRQGDALLAQREAELRDLASKLAEMAATASADRIARRNAERMVEVIAASRGYRIGLRLHRVRLEAKRAVRTIVAGPRSIARRLVTKLSRGKWPDRTQP
jgi:hypothetical protein